MAYNDPYASSTRIEEHYNPYAPQQYATQPYDTAGGAGGYGGYQDEPFAPPGGSSKTFQSAGAPAAGQQPSDVAEKAAVKGFRYDHQENLWTKGGRGRCIGRFFCCGLMGFVFLLISIVLTFALWIAPPNVIIYGVIPPTSANAIIPTAGGIAVALGVNISVHNPNAIDVTFKSITADFKYKLAGSSPDIGNGTANNVVFKSHATTWFTFPFTIDYEFANDPQQLVLIDLGTKCGIFGGAVGNLPLDYTIKPTLQVLSFTVAPSISSTISFKCPSQIKDAIDKAASSLGPGIFKGLGGSRR